MEWGSKAVWAAGATLTPVALFAAVKVRKKLPARVNCWFCNANKWVPYRTRHGWICDSCDQYNGFTRDGDYNAHIDTRTHRTSNFARQTRPFAGSEFTLCRRCNSDQRMKVAQLAGFVPMKERDFDREIDAFKEHLDKVYKLCSKCRRILKYKLSTEKELHLNTKLLNARVRHAENDTEVVNFLEAFKNGLCLILKTIAVALMLLMLLDIIMNVDIFLSKNMIHSTKRYFYGTYKNITTFLAPYYSIITDPLKGTPVEVNTTLIRMLLTESKKLYFDSIFEFYDACLCIYALSGFGCMIQLLMHICAFNFSLRHICNDILWSIIFYNANQTTKYLQLLQIFLVIVAYFNMDINYTRRVMENVSTNREEKLWNSSASKDSIVESGSEDESDFDDDYLVRSQMPVANQYMPRKNGNRNFLLNSSFGASSTSSQCTLTSSPLFGRGRGLYDFQLDKSIGDLSIHRKGQNTTYPTAFSMRRYESPNSNIFGKSTAPSISSNKFVQGTRQSWVAGGYWGADGPSVSYDPREASSSSSQSSGFESLPSTFRPDGRTSLPSSRDGSICGERDNLQGRSESPDAPQLLNFQLFRSPTLLNVKNDEFALFPGVPYGATCIRNRSAFSQR